MRRFPRIKEWGEGEIGQIEASFLFAGGPREKSGFEAN